MNKILQRILLKKNGDTSLSTSRFKTFFNELVDDISYQLESFNANNTPVKLITMRNFTTNFNCVYFYISLRRTK